MTVEILFTAWNRLEMSQVSFQLLKENTNWSLVDRLIAYDDNSEDGTGEWLREEGKTVGVPAFEFRQTHFRAVGAIMNDYFAGSSSEWVAKIDNDIAVPPLWLESMLSVVERHPDVELLGMDGGWQGVADPWQPPAKCGFTEASHIGGVGLMRVESFHRRPGVRAMGRQGFTHWQHTHGPVRGWIAPGLAVAQLDLIPEEPWVSLAEKYVRLGWARHWSPYSPLHPWWSWIGEQIAVAA